MWPEDMSYLFTLDHRTSVGSKDWCACAFCEVQRGNVPQHFVTNNCIVKSEGAWPECRMADRRDSSLYMWDEIEQARSYGVGHDGNKFRESLYQNPNMTSDPSHMDNTGPMSRPPPPLAHTHTHPHSHGHLFNPPPTQPPSTPTSRPPDIPRHPSLDTHPLAGPSNAHGQPPIVSSSIITNASGSPLVVPQPLKAQRSIRTYHCRMCDQIFDNKSDLLVHSQQVHKQDPKPYKCPTCNKCFANSSYLSQHARIHAGIKPYKCQICERRFTQLCHLQQHIRTHTGEKPYKCQYAGCGKAFSQLSNLQSHSRSHMTDKPYRCNSCYKCFADEQSLREHIPKHAETKHLKTHICHICGKSYTQDTYLARHMAKHQGVDSGNRIGPVATSSTPIKPATDSIIPSSIPPPLRDQQQQPPDIKQFDLTGGLTSQDPMANKPSSAFMPLGHQFVGSSNLINSTVPSSFPFPSPRLPNNTLNSPLSHISPPGATMSSSRYFPFDPITFPKRDSVDRGMTREGMIANQLLSLQQIKNFSTSHPVFPKSEPSSPVHKDYKDF